MDATGSLVYMQRTYIFSSVFTALRRFGGEGERGRGRGTKGGEGKGVGLA